MLAIFFVNCIVWWQDHQLTGKQHIHCGWKKNTSVLALWYLYLLHVNIVTYSNMVIVFFWWQEHPFAGIEKTVVSSCSSSDQSSLTSSKQQHLHSFHWSQIFQRVSEFKLRSREWKRITSALSDLYWGGVRIQEAKVAEREKERKRKEKRGKDVLQLNLVAAGSSACSCLHGLASR